MENEKPFFIFHFQWKIKNEKLVFIFHFPLKMEYEYENEIWNMPDL